MNEQNRKHALFGHQLLMTNISIFHLLIPIVAFSTDFVKEAVLFCFVSSLIFLMFIAKGTKTHSNNAFVLSHWKKALQRSRYLLIAYAVSGCVMLLGWVLTSTQTDPQMQKILLTTFIPMATVPTLITVICVLILQTMTITRAKQCLEPNNKF